MNCAIGILIKNVHIESKEGFQEHAQDIANALGILMEGLGEKTKGAIRLGPDTELEISAVPMPKKTPDIIVPNGANITRESIH